MVRHTVYAAGMALLEVFQDTQFEVVAVLAV
jgi:hypothetical protein